MNRKYGSFLRIAPILMGSGLLISIFFSAGIKNRDFHSIQRDLINFEITREPRVGSARISLVTEQETAITINADKVISRSAITDPHPISLDLHNPFGIAEFPSGDIVWFSGDFGKIDDIYDSIRLNGSVKVWTAVGYLATMDSLNSNLQSTYIVGDGNINASGPFGDILSNKLEIFPNSFTDGSYFLKFTGNVFATYWPDE